MLCGKQTVNQIKADQIALLLGITQSLKDGDTTVEEVMIPYRSEENKKNRQECRKEHRSVKQTKKLWKQFKNQLVHKDKKPQTEQRICFGR